MCGRFVLSLPVELLRFAFPWLVDIIDEVRPRYNIAPSQQVAVIPNNHPNTLEMFRWGLIPTWAKDVKIGSRMINARSETLAQKPSFRSAYRRRRCLVLADGFFEWRTESSGPKTPMFIRLRSQQPFAFAGLWESWRPPEGEPILSCTIVTTKPNELIAPIHNRMPVILPETGYQRWLSPEETEPEDLQGLLEPYPAELMEAFAVSRDVNSPKNDYAELIQPVAG